MQRIAILASGTGSNTANIIEHFADSDSVEVKLIATNKKTAGVLRVAQDYGIASYILTMDNFLESDEFVNHLKKLKIEFVILAGFLWKVPLKMVKTFEGRMLNIHPALLPKHGGKGMFGHHVHEAVHKAGDKESGITIHLVNQHYDKGDVYFQVRTNLRDEDTPQDIERRVRELEIAYFPDVIEKFISENS